MPAIVDLAGVSRANAYLIPAEQLEQKEDSRRWSDQDVTDLALDIAERGQLQPVLVTWDKTQDGKERLVIVAGRRRVAAIRQINQRGGEPMKVLCLHFKGAETFAAATVENRKRKGLSAIDLAFDIQTLLDLGKSRKEIAKLLEISEPLISRTLTLLKLPVAIQRDIHKGKISTEAGYEMVPMEPQDRERVSGHPETATSQPSEAQTSQPEETFATATAPDPKSFRRLAQASQPQATPSPETGQPSQPEGETVAETVESSQPPAKVTRSSIRTLKREKAERGEETAGPIGRSRKEIREIFAAYATCDDGTIEEPIRKCCATIVSCIDGEVGSRAVLNRLRELTEGD